MKKQSGFTLIELLLVLAIIGIISAIAIPALLGQRARAKAKATQSMVANVAGECARVNDTLKENAAVGATVTAQNVVDAVLLLSNFKTPAAKNPYGGTGAPYISGASATNGVVGLTANDNYVDKATARTYGAVVIGGQFLNPATNTTSTVTKVVALD